MSSVYDCANWPASLASSTQVLCEANSALFGSAISSDVFTGAKTNINLDSNALTGSLNGLGNDPATKNALVSVSLKNNSLAGTIPDSIGNLSSLQTLDLRNNSLTGTIPGSFALLRSLTSLHLDGNSFEGCVPCPVSPSTINCSANDRIVGVLANGSHLLWCTVTLSPDNTGAGGNGNLGIETFETSNEFVLVMVSLAGTLIFLFLYCFSSAVYLRRRRFLRRIIEGDNSRDFAVESHPVANVQATAAAGRDRSSSAARQGALSFDGREGWRSDAELRGSTRGSRASSARGNN